MCGTVVQVAGPLSYMMKRSDGRVLKRHVDHVLPRTSESEEPGNRDRSVPEIPQAHICQPSVPFADIPTVPLQPCIPLAASENPALLPLAPEPPGNYVANKGDRAPPTSMPLSPLPEPEGRPTRVRRLPARFKNFVLQWFRDVRKYLAKDISFIHFVFVCDL